MNEQLIADTLAASIAVKQALLADHAALLEIGRVAELCVDALRGGHKILLAGNGGSAADAQHIATELVGRFQQERPALAALALTTDTSLLTAVANDYGFEQVFRRQIIGLGQSGDVFIGLSTSGNSGNVIAATNACRDKGITSVAMTGEGGGRLAELSDVCLCVPSGVTARIQEVHITIGHMLCDLIEQRLFPSD